MATMTYPPSSGSGAPTDATYVTQTANASLSNEQDMASLATGIVKNTTTTGVQSIAAAGTDYYAPGSTDVAVADGGTGASTAAAAATALGVGTGDSPQFTAVNLGHASDTTITRTGAGAIAVEGTAVLLSGGALGTPSSGTLTNATGLPTAGLVDDAVTAAKLLNGNYYRLQSSGSGNYSASGSSNTDISATNLAEQIGISTATGGTDKVVTFPVAFSAAPHIVATTGAAASANAWTEKTAVSTTTGTFRQVTDSGTTASEVFNWRAVGPL